MVVVVVVEGEGYVLEFVEPRISRNGFEVQNHGQVYKPGVCAILELRQLYKHIRLVCFSK